MSVINQMLKDLDERQTEANASPSQHIPVNQPKSSVKIVSIILAIFIVLNIVGILIWQLYSENQQLKNQTVEKTPVVIENTKSHPALKNTQNAELDAKKDVTSEVKNKLIENNNAQTNAQPIVEAKAVTANNASLAERKEVKNEEIKVSTERPNNVVNSPKEEQLPSSSNENKAIIHSSINTSNQSPVSKPKLMISRKKLTAEELARQKIDMAEQALNANKFEKAEALFEEVLVINAHHKVARKQLAALWFGRQSYQAAINLLSQGIHLAPQDSDFRLMTARIYLSQGQEATAVDSLEKLPNVRDVEYQSLLATHAQKIERFAVAASAYQVLTEIEPDIARWWLGLAVAFDSNSEFDAAVNAYKSALSKPNLSNSTQQFIRQRLQVLGV